MISPEIQELLDYAGESHEAAKVLVDRGFIGFSAAQSYYTMFYLAIFESFCGDCCLRQRIFENKSA